MQTTLSHNLHNKRTIKTSKAALKRTTHQPTSLHENIPPGTHKQVHRCSLQRSLQRPCLTLMAVSSFGFSNYLAGSRWSLVILHCRTGAQLLMTSGKNVFRRCGETDALRGSIIIMFTVVRNENKIVDRIR